MKSILPIIFNLGFALLGLAQNKPNILWIITDDYRPDVALADWFRNKLGNILLGDRRVECG